MPQIAIEETSSVEQEPHLIIRPSTGWQAINLAEVWNFRDLLITLAQRDVKLRYRQTSLGVLWVVLQPLIAAGIFSFVFGSIAGLPSDGVPSIVFSYAGLLGWNVFSNTLVKTSGVLLGNAGLISKVYFPRLVLPLSTIFSTLIDFAVALGMLAVLMVAYRVVPGPQIVLLPLWLFLIVLLSIGVGLYTAALAVSYRDVQYILPVATQFLLYGSPVAYSLSFALAKIPPQYKTLYLLNPLSGLLQAFRWSILGTGIMPWGAVAYSALVSILAFVVGAFAFRKMERKFADVI
jgi:lipopolysaccharide transport system permease protein